MAIKLLFKTHIFCIIFVFYTPIFASGTGIYDIKPEKLTTLSNDEVETLLFREFSESLDPFQTNAREKSQNFRFSNGEPVLFSSNGTLVPIPRTVSSIPKRSSTSGHLEQDLTEQELKNSAGSKMKLFLPIRLVQAKLLLPRHKKTRWASMKEEELPTIIVPQSDRIFSDEFDDNRANSKEEGAPASKTQVETGPVETDIIRVITPDLPTVTGLPNTSFQAQKNDPTATETATHKHMTPTTANDYVNSNQKIFPPWLGRPTIPQSNFWNGVPTRKITTTRNFNALKSPGFRINRLSLPPRQITLPRYSTTGIANVSPPRNSANIRWAGIPKSPAAALKIRVIPNVCSKVPPFQPCVSKNEANNRARQCCLNRRIPYGCQALCNYDVTLFNFYTRTKQSLCPEASIKNILGCLAGGNDVRPCCNARGVTTESRAVCGNLCYPDSGRGLPPLGVQLLRCAPQMQTINYCYWAGIRL